MSKPSLFLKSQNMFFGEHFGGMFVPENLKAALLELAKAYENILPTPPFQNTFKDLCTHFIGRPTPLIFAQNTSAILGNEIYLKFEGLANTGAHKINNALGQVLLAKMMGKTKVIAETGAGQHGLATASACAKLGLECHIYMGAKDVKRQRPNVFNMELLGAHVHAVEKGDQGLKDAVDEALGAWSKQIETTHYVLGSAVGPYPYPDLVRDLQSVIGKELKEQIKDYFEGLPDILVACIGGGSNAMGFFSAFLEDWGCALYGVEGGGRGTNLGEHATRMRADKKMAIAHGFQSIFIQDDQGNLAKTHSISAGLDYVGIGPQIAYLESIGRLHCLSARDEEALHALQFFAKHEGIIAALESSHALAGVLELSKNFKNKKIIAHVSGRGDKDIFITAKHAHPQRWLEFLEHETLELREKLNS
ncbi:tryptophan synthase subunit beta [Helicobacter bizzozeronii]|uniref:tryptophan synthase subunit beta n=1 Tax=Helicobacter bizzozeronii TaxID=56877 RepID=UPI000CF0A8E0|nr:tryptophan synthase subunit beta [Helicobacter bizzozeronii]